MYHYFDILGDKRSISYVIPLLLCHREGQRSNIRDIRTKITRNLFLEPRNLLTISNRHHVTGLMNSLILTES
jgi:hypothetical protein